MNQNFPFDHFIKANNSNKLSDSSVNLSNPFDFSSLGNNEDKSNKINNLTDNSRFLENFKNVISAEKYDVFFKDKLELVKNENKIIFIDVKDAYLRQIIEQHYLDKIEECISTTFDNSHTYRIIDSSSEEKLAPKTANEAKFTINLNETTTDKEDGVDSKFLEHVEPNNLGLIIDPGKTFSSFVIGPSNNMACATAKAVAQNPGKNGKYPSLYIYSNSGLGKTHLLHAVGNEINKAHSNLIIYLTTAREFMTEMITAIQNNNIGEFRKKYSESIDVLMIDDIHELKDKQGTQNEFFHIFNELHNKGKQLIFTSDKSPNEIDGIAERIKTRLQWGLVIDIQRPDLETRIAILKRKAYELDLYLQDDVLNLIATSIKSSIRELEGSLIKLSAFADVMQVEIDTELAKDLLKLNSQDDAKVIDIESIVKNTSQYFKIPVADIKSKARNKEITRARHIAMYLSRKLINSTQQEIGKFFGGRDHSSVIHAVKNITEKLAYDSSLSKDVLTIESNL